MLNNYSLETCDLVVQNKFQYFIGIRFKHKYLLGGKKVFVKLVSKNLMKLLVPGVQGCLNFICFHLEKLNNLSFSVFYHLRLLHRHNSEA